MNRRSLFKYAAMLGVGRTIVGAGSALAAPAGSTSGKGPIVLYCDLAIPPAKEQQMLDHWHNDFVPAARKFDGFIDVKIVKLRKVLQGQPVPPAGINYRFQLTYESEEKRQKWISSDTHKRVWPQIENLVANKDYIVLLTDSM